MGGHYDKDIFKQLQEVLERSDRIENEIRENKAEHKLELKQQEIKLKEEFNEERNQFNVRISSLETELAVVKTENVPLHNDNERMKRIINNDSSNTQDCCGQSGTGRGCHVCDCVRRGY